MPIFTPETVKTDVGTDVNDPCGTYTAQLFSDTGGLTQFGAFVEILPAGSASSVKHWHAVEDEMVYMIAGEVMVVEGDTKTLMTAGQAATFKAGAPLGHCIRNEGDAEARYLVIGTRSKGDTVTYPDNDCILHFDRSGPERLNRWTTLDGAPSVSPYSAPRTAKNVVDSDDG